MNDSWTTEDSCVIIGESSDDEDSLILCILDSDAHMMTAVLDRQEIESLVEYMAEWVGFPLVISNTSVGGYNDWPDE
jgi:hypothetical protein